MSYTIYYYILIISLCCNSGFAKTTGTPNALPALSCSLFKAYPGLVQKKHKPSLTRIAHVSLGTFPTPIQKLRVLGAAVGASHLYVKRDDLSGDLFAGNKVRKLEFLFGHALACKAQGVLTQGFAGSNHTCATAVYAKTLGLHCSCLHLPQPPTSYARRNLLLSHLYGADLTIYPTVARRDTGIYEKNRAFKRRTNQPLYFIPSGGSNEIGTLGFVNAMFELKEQIAAGVMPEPEFIYVALGSCATTAGMLLGVKAAGLKAKIIGVCIEPDIPQGAHVEKIKKLFLGANTILHNADSTFKRYELEPDNIIINHDFVGEDYAIISKDAHAAITLMAQTEGINLDGTYTGKACAAMLHDIVKKDLSSNVILFWDSFSPGNYADVINHVDYKDLPPAYHHYFIAQLQDLDQGV